MAVEIDLSVENTCTKCYGSKVVYDNGKEETCNTCNGEGYVLTELGHDIITMLRRRNLLRA